MSNHPIVCAFGAFSEEQKQEYNMIITKLQQERLNVIETESGFDFIYNGSLDALSYISRWINYERRCCPFLSFVLYVNDIGTNIKLSITGSKEAITFIKEEFENKNVL